MGVQQKARAAAQLTRSRLRAMSQRRQDPEGFALAERLRAKRLTFLETEGLLDLRRRARELDATLVPGVFIEAGCALGGSAIMLAGSKDPTRRLEVYDVFGMIPPPSDRDGEDVLRRYEVIAAGEAEGFQGDTYYGYQPELKQKVARSFDDLGYPCAANNVHLIEGLFQDTIRPSGPVALAHIDGDWYESVKVCLERIWPMLSTGGVIVVDDYDAWSGCRTAVDEFIANLHGVKPERQSRLHLIKTDV